MIRSQRTRKPSMKALALKVKSPPELRTQERSTITDARVQKPPRSYLKETTAAKRYSEPSSRSNLTRAKRKTEGREWTSQKLVEDLSTCTPERVSRNEREAANKAKRKAEGRECPGEKLVEDLSTPERVSRNETKAAKRAKRKAEGRLCPNHKLVEDLSTPERVSRNETKAAKRAKRKTEGREWTSEKLVEDLSTPERVSRNETKAAKRANRKTEGRECPSEKLVEDLSTPERDMRYKTGAIPGCGVNRYVFVGTESSNHSTFPLELCFHQGPSILELHADDKPLMAFGTNTEICRGIFQERYADVERSLPTAMTIPTTMTRIMEPLKEALMGCTPMNSNSGVGLWEWHDIVSDVTFANLFSKKKDGMEVDKTIVRNVLRSLAEHVRSIGVEAEIQGYTLWETVVSFVSAQECFIDPTSGKLVKPHI